MNFTERKLLKVGYLAAMVSLLSACGGGGGESDGGKLPETQQITYQALSSVTQVNEGDTVTLSLNTTGNGSGDIKFNWDLDEDITFTGQGTDTISFVAPEVERSGSINVKVDIDSSSGTVIGFVSQSVFVNVQNVEKIGDNQGGSQMSELPVVDVLDLTKLTDGSSWYQEQVSHVSTIHETGNPLTIDLSVRNLFYIETVNSSKQSMTVSACGLESQEEFSIPNYGATLSCESGESQLRLSQNDNEFAIERLCGETVLQASKFKKISDDRVTSNGELTIDFSSYEDIEAGTKACGLTSTSEVKLFDQSGVILESSIASVLRVFTEYQGNPFELQFVLDKSPTFGFTSLGSPVNTNNIAKVFSSVLPEINNVNENKIGGLVDFDFKSTPTNVIAEFDFKIPATTGIDETLEGSLKLNFE